MDPITSSITIDRPREEVFEYLADIANHPEFSDHFLKQWRLLRVDSYGTGAGARFQRDARRVHDRDRSTAADGPPAGGPDGDARLVQAQGQQDAPAPPAHPRRGRRRARPRPPRDGRGCHGVVEDRGYLTGLPEGVAPSPKEPWFGVFLRVQNNTEEVLPTASEFEIVDTDERVYRPVPLDEATNIFAYRPTELGPRGLVPAE